MPAELEVSTTYDEFGLSNLLDRLQANKDASYELLGLTNLLDRLEEATKKITAFNIDDFIEDKSVSDSKIIHDFSDVETYSYLYVDRSAKTLHLGIEDAGYRLALSAGSSTPRIFVDENGHVGFNIQNPLYRVHILGSVYITNQESSTLLASDPFTIITGGVNTRGQVIRGSRYGATYTSRWVAVGLRTGVGNTIFYSDDGVTWTPTTALTIFANVGYDVSWGDDKFVAVGQGTNSLAYSSDGVSWTGLGTSIFSTEGRDIVWNGRVFVAVGAGTNTIAYSSNGINWTGVGTTIFSTTGYGVSWNGEMFIATGSGTDNSMAYSYDGISWTGLGFIVGESYCTAVVTNGDHWLVTAYVGGTWGQLYSTDGLTWVYLGVTFSTNLRGAAWTGTYWIGGGSDTVASARLKLSTSGLVWNSIGGGVFTGATDSVYSVGWDGSKYVAAGVISLAGRAAYSTDGASWTATAAFTGCSLVYGLASQKAPELIPEMPGTPVTPVDQIANLSEWQNYLGELLAYVDPLGKGVFQTLSILSFTSAGFLKNDTSGVVTGGNSITISDITDWSPETLLQSAICFDGNVVVNDDEIVYL